MLHILISIVGSDDVNMNLIRQKPLYFNNLESKKIDQITLPKIKSICASPVTKLLTEFTLYHKIAIIYDVMSTKRDTAVYIGKMGRLEQSSIIHTWAKEMTERVVCRSGLDILIVNVNVLFRAPICAATNDKLYN